MNKPFENTFEVKFDENAMKTFNDLIKEKGIRHFKLETDLYGVLDVVLYEEYQNLEKEIDRLNNIISELEKFLNEVDIVQRDRENIPNDHITIYNILLDKLKELKENNNGR